MVNINLQYLLIWTVEMSSSTQEIPLPTTLTSLTSSSNLRKSRKFSLRQRIFFTISKFLAYAYLQFNFADRRKLFVLYFTRRDLRNGIQSRRDRWIVPTDHRSNTQVNWNTYRINSFQITEQTLCFYIYMKSLNTNWNRRYRLLGCALCFYQFSVVKPSKRPWSNYLIRARSECALYNHKPKNESQNFQKKRFTSPHPGI